MRDADVTETWVMQLRSNRYCPNVTAEYMGLGSTCTTGPVVSFANNTGTAWSIQVEWTQPLITNQIAYNNITIRPGSRSSGSSSTSSSSRCSGYVSMTNDFPCNVSSVISFSPTVKEYFATPLYEITPGNPVFPTADSTQYNRKLNTFAIELRKANVNDTAHCPKFLGVNSKCNETGLVGYDKFTKNFTEWTLEPIGGSEPPTIQSISAAPCCTSSKTTSTTSSSMNNALCSPETVDQYCVRTSISDPPNVPLKGWYRVSGIANAKLASTNATAGSFMLIVPACTTYALNVSGVYGFDYTDVQNTDFKRSIVYETPPAEIQGTTPGCSIQTWNLKLSVPRECDNGTIPYISFPGTLSSTPSTSIDTLVNVDGNSTSTGIGIGNSTTGAVAAELQALNVTGWSGGWDIEVIDGAASLVHIRAQGTGGSDRVAVGQGPAPRPSPSAKAGNTSASSTANTTLSTPSTTGWFLAPTASDEACDSSDLSLQPNPYAWHITRPQLFDSSEYFPTYWWSLKAPANTVIFRAAGRKEGCKRDLAAAEGCLVGGAGLQLYKDRESKYTTFALEPSELGGVPLPAITSITTTCSTTSNTCSARVQYSMASAPNPTMFRIEYDGMLDCLPYCSNVLPSYALPSSTSTTTTTSSTSSTTGLTLTGFPQCTTYKMRITALYNATWLSMESKPSEWASVTTEGCGTAQSWHLKNMQCSDKLKKEAFLSLTDANGTCQTPNLGFNGTTSMVTLNVSSDRPYLLYPRVSVASTSLGACGLSGAGGSLTSDSAYGWEVIGVGLYNDRKLVSTYTRPYNSSYRLALSTQDGQYLGADVNCTQLQLHKDLYNGTQPHYTEWQLIHDDVTAPALTVSSSSSCLLGPNGTYPLATCTVTFSTAPLSDTYKFQYYRTVWKGVSSNTTANVNATTEGIKMRVFDFDANQTAVEYQAKTSTSTSSSSSSTSGRATVALWDLDSSGCGYAAYTVAGQVETPANMLRAWSAWSTLKTTKLCVGRRNTSGGNDDDDDDGSTSNRDLRQLSEAGAGRDRGAGFASSNVQERVFKPFAEMPGLVGMILAGMVLVKLRRKKRFSLIKEW